jgi:hypothetical protein
MADTKISALPASTTPLAGTEVLPIVQSSATKQVSVANLTAGRAISATQLTLTAGNVIPANGYGIDFSATSGTGTSELLADYEEGTWTPSLGGDTTYTQQVGEYTKIGRIVYLRGTLQINVLGTGSTTAVTGLPFNGINKRASGSCGYYGTTAVLVNQLTPVINSATMSFVDSPTLGTGVTDSPAIFGNGTFIFFTVTYQT